MSATIGSAFTLFIETGLHAGTVQRLSPGIYTLGSELDADIVLSDASIQNIHVLLELDRQGLRLEPLQGSVAVEGESVALEPGGERHLALPASFAVGDATVKITAPKDAVQTRRRLQAGVVAAGLVAIAIIGFQVLGGSIGPGADGPMTATMQPVDRRPDAEAKAVPPAADADGPSEQAAAQDAVEPAALEAAAQPVVTLDSAAAALRERLAADGFSDIEVKTAVDRLVVRGEAEPERMGEWQDIRIWFDGAFGRSVPMIATVEPVEASEPPKLAIEAVWSGDDPYLIAGGQRFFVGAHIGDGWTIDRIVADEITFKRGDKLFSLTL